MRVVHLDTGRELRGGQRQVLLLHRGLLARGVDSVVLAPAGAPLLAACAGRGWPAVPLAGRRPWHPRLLGQVRRTARTADVLHVHDPHAATLAALAAGAAAPPVVVHHRRTGFPLRRGAVQRLKYRRVDRWIAVTEAIRSELVAWGAAPARVRTVPSAIDLAAVRAAATAGADIRQRLGLPAAGMLVAAVGALDAQKGFEVLVRALARLVAQGRELSGVLVGTGPERQRLADLAAALGLGDRLLMAGERSDVPAVLAAADACVVPSLAAEGSNAVAKEAMAVGCPLLVSAVPGLEEVAGSAAASVPPGDAGALAAALGGLLDDRSATARRVADGHVRVAAFDVPQLVDAVLEVYHAGVAEVRP